MSLAFSNLQPKMRICIFSVLLDQLEPTGRI